MYKELKTNELLRFNSTGNFFKTGQETNHKSAALSWIEAAKNAPYFVTENGDDWLPVGQNDAITWVDLAGAFRRRDLKSVENYFEMLAGNGVNCMRLMLEYCQGEHRYFERPAGRFQPNMVRLWDDLFGLCEKYNLRILLTPYDTFWMWIRWKRHPYNKANGGICDSRSNWLLCSETRRAIKKRLAFAAERWSGSGALFAWDVWNEIHPAHAGDSADVFAEFVDDVSSFLRETEIRLYGRAHPQTVSIFLPVMDFDARIPEIAFRHSSLDFANVHLYEKDTIDYPRNTIDAAISVGKLIRKCLTEITDNRPLFDSEHGPIHLFKDRKVTLPEAFDDEYFRHIQWAHLASGGAGGGMRWANRHPHTLTNGMRKAQHSLAKFLPLIDWQNFQRQNLNEEINLSDENFAVFGCGDDKQSVIWLLRKNELDTNGMIRKNLCLKTVKIKIPNLQAGRYKVSVWETKSGNVSETFETYKENKDFLRFELKEIKSDIAAAVRKI